MSEKNDDDILELEALSPIGKLMHSAELDPLLDRLTTYVEKVGAHVDRKALRDVVWFTGCVYEDAHAEINNTGSTLHKLPAAVYYLDRLLSDNLSDVLTLFGKPPEMELLDYRGSDPNVPGPMRDALERYEALGETLEILARNAPPPPPPPLRPGRGGRPRTPADLKDTVTFLAQEWEKLTGQRPTQRFVAGEPTTLAACFIYDIVKFVVPDRLGELPTVLKKVVADRIASE